MPMTTQAINMPPVTTIEPHVKQGYVVGWMIDPTTRNVLMIRKNRPDYQVGKWNGIGGKIEPGELPLDAMKREFFEETGIQHEAWEHTLTFVTDNSIIYHYRAFMSPLPKWEQKTDEFVDFNIIHSMDMVSTLDNVKWILPLQLADIQFPLTVIYKGQ